MEINLVLIATIFVTIVSLLVGLFLGFSAIKFEVETDEREILVREALPGANCGACGYPGCDGLASAIVSGKAQTNGCPVGGASCAAKISEIMGVASEFIKTVAFVKCAGDCNKATTKFEYSGIMDCNSASMVPGGTPKGCSYGCMGFGSCVKVCEYDAIHIVDGIAVVDKEKCVSCECCVKACPKNLIEIIPYDAEQRVRCNSNSKMKIVKEVCDVGCIGCKKCVKVCEDEAVFVDNNLAKIDYSKCINCGKCAEVCPQSIITFS